MKNTKLFYLFLVFASIFTIACDDDEVTNELTLSHKEVALMPSKSATVKVKTGNGGYVVKSSDTGIAEAVFNKTVGELKITAVKAGTTTVNVTDNKGKKAMVKVVVKALLTLEKEAVDVVEGRETTVAIKSGSGKYEVTTSDKAIATAVVEGTNIKVTGVAKGEVVVTVTDTDTKVEKKLAVVVKASLNVEKTNVTVLEGNTVTVKVLEGTGNYTVVSSDKNVVTATLKDSTIEITGVAKGEGVVTVTDNDTKSAQDIKVEVKPVLNVDGTTVSLFEGEEKTITVKEGTGNYTVTSSKEAVATVKVEGKNIKITGVAKGEAVVTVTDKDTKEKKEIKVVVKGRLALAKTEIAINQGETERVDIFNVVDDQYDIEVVPADVLKVEKGSGMVAPDGLKITPLKYNKEAVKVTVKSGGQEAVLVVTVNPIDAIKVAKKDVALKLGAKEEVRIIKGNGGYNVEVDNGDVVAAEIKLKQEPNQTPEYVVALEAKAVGTANVKVTDVAGKEATIKVTVKGGLKLGKTELLINMGETERVDVFNVVNNTYEVTVEPKGVLTVEKAGGVDAPDGLKISPLKYSATPVKVTVNSGEQKAVLTVTVNKEDEIRLKKNEVELKVGDKEQIRIIKGNGDYTFEVDNDNVAATLKTVGDDLFVELEGKKAGISVVTMKDAADVKAAINVTVKEKTVYADVDIDDNGVVRKKDGVTYRGDIVLPDEAKEIPPNDDERTPFQENKEITSIDFGGVTKIGKLSIKGCDELTKIYLRKVTELGFGAIANCPKLEEVYCYVEDPNSVTLGVLAFNGDKSKKTLYVPAASLDAYKASNFKNFFGNIEPMK